MDSLSPRARFSMADGKISLDDADLTGKVDILAFEINEGGAWLKLGIPVEVGDIDFSFPVTQIERWLGGAPAGVAITPAEVEAALVQAMGFSSEPDAAGKAICQLLADKGIEIEG